VILTAGMPRNFFSLETVPTCKKVWEPLGRLYDPALMRTERDKTARAHFEKFIHDSASIKAKCCFNYHLCVWFNQKRLDI